MGESREDNKEFEYDYSYWSVNPADMHFITQEQVRMCVCTCACVHNVYEEAELKKKTV